MKFVPVLIVVVALGVFWLVERAGVVAAQLEIEALQESMRDAAAVRNEHARLQALQPSPDEWQHLQRVASERARVSSALAARESEKERQQAMAFQSGESVAVHLWQNRGRGTPAATIETLLWSAAGGDVDTLASLLHLDPEVRVLADDLFARISGTARDAYRSPEELISAFTTKAIPLGRAQIEWQQQTSGDESVVCLALYNPIPAMMEPPAPMSAQTDGPSRTSAIAWTRCGVSPPFGPASQRERLEVDRPAECDSRDRARTWRGKPCPDSPRCERCRRPNKAKPAGHTVTAHSR